ncbi:Fic family protein [Enterocloster aldenensis]|uniref:Fic family protein n=1 Tax=Enterocloster aldenensis TaxID=358742 RepID=UPI0025A3C24C|nr:Fic family protein [Enterocloster aldenensis]
MEVLQKVDRFQKEINALRPFEGEMLDQIKDYYRIGLTWTSNALEGNSLTESETKVLLEEGLTVGGRPMRDVFEAVDHARAYDFMFSLMKNRCIDESAVLRMHKLFYQNIEPDYAGRYRDMKVVITGSHYPTTAPEKLNREMAGLFQWAAGERERLHPLEFAAELHRHFVFIHPFKDGNGRVARLLMNLALIQDGYLPAVIPPVLRMDYISLLERAHRDPHDFIQFIAERELESQKEILRLFQIPFPKMEQGLSGMELM